MSLFATLAPRIIADLLRDFPQWTELDAAACVGNLGHETGGFLFMQELKPVVPGSAGGYGWAQWTGPRRRAFEAFCRAKGVAPASYEANYGFLVEELRTTEKHTVGAVAKAAGLEAKVVAFEGAFERAGVKHYPSRQRYAQQALAAHHGTKADLPPKKTPKPIPAPIPAQGVIAALIAALFAVAVYLRDQIAGVFNALFN